MRSVHFACWVTRTTDTHPDHVILFYHGKGEHANVAQYYVTLALPVLLTLAIQSRIARVLQLECLRWKFNNYLFVAYLTMLLVTHEYAGYRVERLDGNV